MSLYRTYRVECNGPELAARLARMGRAVPPMRYADHEQYGPGAEESQTARRYALKQGWVRQQRAMPLFANEPDGQTTTIAYDLCPSCAGQIPAHLKA